MQGVRAAQVPERAGRAVGGRRPRGAADGGRVSHRWRGRRLHRVHRLQADAAALELLEKSAREEGGHEALRHLRRAASPLAVRGKALAAADAGGEPVGWAALLRGDADLHRLFELLRPVALAAEADELAGVDESGDREAAALRATAERLYRAAELWTTMTAAR